ncbi:MAG: DUF4381 domain-containing protein [Pseudomonadota bacterium]
MPTELLQRLRDIHYPAEPGWWPPAPGWWLLGLALGVALVMLWRFAASVRRARAPYASARALLNREFAALRAGRGGERAYLDRANEVIKRLLVHVRGDAGAVPASGQDWLQQLDALTASDRFTRGPGQVLGDQRFRPQPNFQPAELHRLVLELIDQLAAAR